MKKAKRAKRNVRLVRQISKRLEAASPTLSKRLLGSLSIDLGDLFFIAETHQHQMKELLRMKFPRDKRRLETLLGRLEVNLLFENDWHLKNLKRRLPQLWTSL